MKKNLTKAERHEIYKKALARFDEKPDFLCFVLGRSMPNAQPWDNVEEGALAEFDQQKPSGARYAWWDLDNAGHRSRRKVLLKCIELTAPALGARKAATKERVPAKQNRATASLKGTGRSRAKATPKKKRA